MCGIAVTGGGLAHGWFREKRRSNYVPASRDRQGTGGGALAIVLLRMFDRFDLYERCVQVPEDLVPILRAIHGRDPKILGEDFCGTGALARSWVRLVDGGRAIAVDHDPALLDRSAGDPAITVVAGDVVRDTGSREHRVDVLHAGNFSIGEWHTRAALVGYLQHARKRMSGHGVFVCDTYGGETAFAAGTIERDVPLPDGAIVRYTWEQREADPLTGRVVNAIHFTMLRDGEPVETVRDAFVYVWRLWTVPELRDAMIDAGFVSTEVYARTPDAIDDDGNVYVSPLVDPADLDETFDVLVVGRSHA